ncbi:hypothetical protein [Vibrio coralliilyticus]|uniref:hypothetical protein n=1 Tax=Vibrio coralliilyticus TaxID=190893 RepID=UPI00148C059B|nr:hypothetical protein [Vibrio coralliilyticus]NOI30195.1 hypothetical protein [Vibrio coralliilyticus]NOI46831.1 hypothetical protein [Vibrio coralliilyticus]
MKKTTIALLLCIASAPALANKYQQVRDYAQLQGYVTVASKEICKKYKTPEMNRVRTDLEYITEPMAQSPDLAVVFNDGYMAGRIAASDQVSNYTGTTEKWCKEKDAGFAQFGNKG